jgi:hypothetical protein
VHLIQQIGAYAGLAAIPGLAVLSALYFSQARDVKRLREWAGRAPERAAEQAAGGRVAAQPQQAAQPGASAAPAVPGAAAAHGTPAAAAEAAKPAGAGKTAAVTPAGVAAAAAAAKAGQQAASAPAAATSTGAAASAPAAATSTGAGTATTAGGGEGANGAVTRPGPPAVGGVKPATPGAAAAAGGAGKPATGSAKPAGAASAVRRPIPRITGAQTSILPPGASSRERWYRRLGARLPAGRYIALIVAGALVLGGGAAFGITQLASQDSGSSRAKPSGAGSAPAQSTSPGGKHHAAAAPAISPSSVTVTVVNGTNIANLARDTASKLSRLGFQIGNTVTGTGPLAAAESVVEYKPGARDKAVFVAAKLHINQKQPADADALAQSGPADVIVVLGADQAPGG